MTTKEARITALELAAGPTESEEEATARSLQELPYDQLEKKAREILARHDAEGPGWEGENLELVQRVRKVIARRDEKVRP
jgi:hypothetical protein